MKTSLRTLILIVLGLIHVWSSEADELMALARQADADRVSLAEAQASWGQEQAQLRIALAALKDQAQRLDQNITQTQAQVEQAAIEEQHQQAERAALEMLIEKGQTTAVAVNDGLNRLYASSLLGFHETSEEIPNGDLGDSLARLADAEIRARAIVSRRLGGVLPDGSALGVEALIFGGVAGWWRAPGGRVGTIDGVDANGRPLLTPIQGEAAESIQQAMDGATNAPVNLPIPAKAEQ